MLVESKEPYGQTRGLRNLEMKHVGKLAIIGALLSGSLSKSGPLHFGSVKGFPSNFFQ